MINVHPIKWTMKSRHPEQTGDGFLKSILVDGLISITIDPDVKQEA